MLLGSGTSKYATPSPLHGGTGLGIGNALGSRKRPSALDISGRCVSQASYGDEVLPRTRSHFIWAGYRDRHRPSTQRCQGTGAWGWRTTKVVVWPLLSVRYTTQCT